MDLSIGKTWNACVFVIESPRGRSAKRPRRVAPRYLSRSAPQGLSITKTHKHSTLENGDIVRWAGSLIGLPSHHKAS